MDTEGQQSGMPEPQTPVSTPTEPSGPPQATPDVQQPTTPPSKEWDYGGQKLDELTTNQLIHLGLLFQNAIVQDRGQPQAQQDQPKPQPQPPVQDLQGQRQPDETLKQFNARMDKLEKMLEDDRQDRARNALLRETEEAIQAAESLKPHMSDETRRKALLGMTATYMAQTGQSPKQAAKFVNDFVSGIEESAKSKYLSGKVQQAGRRVEGKGGSQPAVSNPRAMTLADKGLWEEAANIFEQVVSGSED